MNDAKSPAAVLRQMTMAHNTPQVLYVAAKLRLADLLAGGPRSSADLAAATGADPQALFRLLRALAGIGVLAGADGDGDRWELTDLGRALREDAPDSQRAWVLTMGEFGYPVWGELLYSVRTGRPAFEKVFGQSYYAYRAGVARSGDQQRPRAAGDDGRTGAHGSGARRALRRR